MAIIDTFDAALGFEASAASWSVRALCIERAHDAGALQRARGRSWVLATLCVGQALDALSIARSAQRTQASFVGAVTILNAPCATIQGLGVGRVRLAVSIELTNALGGLDAFNASIGSRIANRRGARTIAGSRALRVSAQRPGHDLCTHKYESERASAVSRLWRDRARQGQSLERG